MTKKARQSAGFGALSLNTNGYASSPQLDSSVVTIPTFGLNALQSGEFVLLDVQFDDNVKR